MHNFIIALQLSCALTGCIAFIMYPRSTIGMPHLKTKCSNFAHRNSAFANELFADFTMPSNFYHSKTPYLVSKMSWQISCSGLCVSTW